MPTEFGMDYNWEHSGAQMVTPPVSCVSLGCWCGVAAALNHLNLRDAAFPFDWNRTTMQGILHFCSTGFADFLHFPDVKPFPESKSSGGKMWQGAHHSVWHEDLSIADGREKYVRRISRFLQNPARTLVFIRVLNSNTEVVEGENLLRILSTLFPKSNVYLLLIADCQLEASRFVVDSTEGRLLIHCIHHSKLGTVEYGGTYPVYHEAVRLAYKQATGCTDPVSMPLLKVRSCVELFPYLAPFFGGHPQEVPFAPTPIPAPKFPPSMSWQRLKPPFFNDQSVVAPGALAQWPTDPVRQFHQLQQASQAQVQNLQLQHLQLQNPQLQNLQLTPASCWCPGADAIMENANHSNKPLFVPGQMFLPSRNPPMTRMVSA